MPQDERGGDPDNGDGLQPCGIGEMLAQMLVVRGFELALDKNPLIRTAYLFAENVGAEPANGFFPRLDLKVHVERRAKNFDVLRLRKPRRLPCANSGYLFFATEPLGRGRAREG